MTSVPRLYDPDPTRGEVPDGMTPQKILERKGFLRVLAFLGDEVDMNDVEAVARDGCGPVALLRVEKLTQLFGVTIDQLKQKME